MTGKIIPLCERDTCTIQAAADAFLLGGESPGSPLRSHLLRLDGVCARRLIAERDQHSYRRARE